MSLPVSFVEVRAISHATEDLSKVEHAVKQVVGEEALDEEDLVKEKLEGHHGNPIILLKAKIHSKSQARKIIRNIFSGLEEESRSRLSAEVESRVDDDGSFYVRLDKQAAYAGRLQFGETDSIRIQIKLAMPHRQRKRIIQAIKQVIPLQ